MINKDNLVKLLEKVECLVIKKDDFSFCIFDFNGKKTSFLNFELTKEQNRQIQEEDETTIDDEHTVFFDIESVLNYLDKGKVFIPLSSCIGYKDEIHFLNGETICYEDYSLYEDEQEEKEKRTLKFGNYNNLGVVLYKSTDNEYDFKLAYNTFTEGCCIPRCPSEFDIKETETLDEYTDIILECMKEFE